MVRKNRVVLRDAVYHITSRVAHREFLFAVDAVKERYSRRMYNGSQLVKTLKELIAMVYNRERGHEAFWFWAANLKFSISSPKGLALRD